MRTADMGYLRKCDCGECRAIREERAGRKRAFMEAPQKPGTRLAIVRRYGPHRVGPRVSS